MLSVRSRRRRRQRTWKWPVLRLIAVIERWPSHLRNDELIWLHLSSLIVLVMSLASLIAPDIVPSPVINELLAIRTNIVGTGIILFAFMLMFIYITNRLLQAFQGFFIFIFFILICIFHLILVPNYSNIYHISSQSINFISFMLVLIGLFRTTKGKPPEVFRSNETSM